MSCDGWCVGSHSSSESDLPFKLLVSLKQQTAMRWLITGRDRCVNVICDLYSQTAPIGHINRLTRKVVGSLRQQAAMLDRHRCHNISSNSVTVLLWLCCLALTGSRPAAAATAAAAVLHVPKGASASEHLPNKAPVAADNATHGDSWPPAERMLAWIVENGGKVGATCQSVCTRASTNPCH
jgi:hypothetical protein